MSKVKTLITILTICYLSLVAGELTVRNSEKCYTQWFNLRCGNQEKLRIIGGYIGKKGAGTITCDLNEPSICTKPLYLVKSVYYTELVKKCSSQACSVQVDWGHINCGNGNILSNYGSVSYVCVKDSGIIHMCSDTTTFSTEGIIESLNFPAMTTTHNDCICHMESNSSIEIHLFELNMIDTDQEFQIKTSTEINHYNGSNYVVNFTTPIQDTAMTIQFHGSGKPNRYTLKYKADSKVQIRCSQQVVIPSTTQPSKPFVSMTTTSSIPVNEQSTRTDVTYTTSSVLNSTSKPFVSMTTTSSIPVNEQSTRTDVTYTTSSVLNSTLDASNGTYQLPVKQPITFKSLVGLFAGILLGIINACVFVIIIIRRLRNQKEVVNTTGITQNGNISNHTRRSGINKSDISDPQPIATIDKENPDYDDLDFDSFSEFDSETEENYYNYNESASNNIHNTPANYFQNTGFKTDDITNEVQLNIKTLDDVGTHTMQHFQEDEPIYMEAEPHVEFQISNTLNNPLGNQYAVNNGYAHSNVRNTEINACTTEANQNSRDYFEDPAYGIHERDTFNDGQDYAAVY